MGTANKMILMSIEDEINPYKKANFSQYTSTQRNGRPAPKDIWKRGILEWNLYFMKKKVKCRLRRPTIIYCHFKTHHWENTSCGCGSNQCVILLWFIYLWWRFKDSWSISRCWVLFFCQVFAWYLWMICWRKTLYDNDQMEDKKYD